LLAFVGLGVFIDFVVADFAPFLSMLCLETIRHIVAACVAKGKDKGKTTKNHIRNRKKQENQAS